MVLDFSTAHGLAQLDSSFSEPAPDTLYYPDVVTQVKVQGELFVASHALNPLRVRADQMVALVDRLDSRIPALMRALTAA